MMMLMLQDMVMVSDEPELLDELLELAELLLLSLSMSTGSASKEKRRAMCNEIYSIDI
jgi:hypothetical protein